MFGIWEINNNNKNRKYAIKSNIVEGEKKKKKNEKGGGGRFVVKPSTHHYGHRIISLLRNHLPRKHRERAHAIPINYVRQQTIADYHEGVRRVGSEMGEESGAARRFLQEWRWWKGEDGRAWWRERGKE